MAKIPAKNPSKTLILLECAVAVGRGVESRGAKKVSPEAVKEWRRFFSQGIQDALDANFPWSLSRANALKVAKHMGQIAAGMAEGWHHHRRRGQEGRRSREEGQCVSAAWRRRTILRLI